MCLSLSLDSLGNIGLQQPLSNRCSSGDHTHSLKVLGSEQSRKCIIYVFLLVTILLEFFVFIPPVLDFLLSHWSLSLDNFPWECPSVHWRSDFFLFIFFFFPLLIWLRNWHLRKTDGCTEKNGKMQGKKTCSSWINLLMSLSIISEILSKNLPF